MKNAKRIILIFVLINFFAINIGKAQDNGFAYGTILGIGQTQVRCDGLSNSAAKVGFTAGFASAYKFNRFFGLTLDITGNTKGFKTNGSEYTFPSQEHKYTENYTFVDVDVPVMAKLYLGSDRLNVNLMAGLSMNFNVLAVSTRTFDESGYNNDNGYSGKSVSGIDPVNTAYTAGVGLTARAAENYYFIHLRTVGPLSAFGKINNNSAYHSGFNITFGYLFY